MGVKENRSGESVLLAEDALLLTPEEQLHSFR